METISLQTLTPHEAEQVSGGIIPAIIGGLIGSYIYDELGGYDGINEMAVNAMERLGRYYRRTPGQFVYGV